MIPILDKNKFLTTFNEKASARNTVAFRPPHELRKFQDLRILDIAAGLNHILLFAVSKVSPSISLDITSSDANENIPVHTLPESDTSVKSTEHRKRSIGLTHQNSSDFKNIVSPRPILTKETLEAIQADVQSDANVPIEEPIVTKSEIHSVKSEKLTNQVIEESIESESEHSNKVNNSDKVSNLGKKSKSIGKTAETTDKVDQTHTVKTLEEVEKTRAIKKLEKVEKVEQIEAPPENPSLNTKSEKAHLVKTDTEDQLNILAMDMVTKSVSNIGDSFMNDIKSIATAGEEKLNNLAKETEKTIKEVPNNVIDYVKTSVGLGKEETDKVMDANMDGKENTSKELPKLTGSDMSNDLSGSKSPIQNIAATETDISETVKHNNKLNRALAEDDSNETVIDDLKDDVVDNEVKFINNGIDVSSSSNIIQAMKDEVNEMSNDVKTKSDELTMKYDGIINDELNVAKEAASTKMFQMKNGKIGIRNRFDLFTQFYFLNCSWKGCDERGYNVIRRLNDEIHPIET